MYALGIGTTYAFGMGLMLGAFAVLVAMLVLKALHIRYRLRREQGFFYLDAFARHPRRLQGLRPQPVNRVVPARAPHASSL